MDRIASKWEISFPLGVDTLLFILLGFLNLWFNPAVSALMVVLLTGYVWMDLSRTDEIRGSGRGMRFLRWALVCAAVVAAAVVPTIYEIIQRRSSAPYLYAHDSLIQTEAALDFLAAGRNPYAVDYSDTPLIEWYRRGSPTSAPLRYYAYPPFELVFSLPFFAFSHQAVGWYDQRFLYLLLWLPSLLFLTLLTKMPAKQRALVLIFGLNVFVNIFFIEGRNDHFLLFWVLLTILLLSRNHIVASAIPLSLAVATKQSAWLLVPFYLGYLAATLPEGIRSPTFRHSVLGVVATVGAIVGPFLLWDPTAYWEDTVLFIAGATPERFPILGYTVGQLAVAVGLIPSPESPFPFWILQAVYAPMAMIWLLRHQRPGDLGFTMLAFGAFSLGFMLLSRYFTENHLGFLIQVMALAYFVENPSPRIRESGPITSVEK